MPFKESRKQE